MGLFGWVGKFTMVDDRMIEGHRNITETIKTGRIANVWMDNGTEYSYGQNTGLICGTNEGEIYNVMISGSTIYVERTTNLGDVSASTSTNYAGMICAINNGVIEKCLIKNCSISVGSSSAALYSGGICAENNGSVVGCCVDCVVYGTVAGGICAENNGFVDFCAYYGTAVKCSQTTKETTACAGGICAINNNRVSNVIVKIDKGTDNNPNGIQNVSEESSATIYIGGLIGKNSGECFNGFVDAYIVDKGSVGAKAISGILIGFINTDSSYNVMNNKYINNQGDIAIVGSIDTVSVDNSNCAITNLGDVISRFNDYNTTYNNNNSDKQLKDYSWIVSDNEIEFEFSTEITESTKIGAKYNNKYYGFAENNVNDNEEDNIVEENG